MPRILIADDEELERKALRLIIRNGTALADTDIDEAASGRTALEMLKSRDYDTAFFDVMMPGMNGIAAIAGMHDEGIDVPVVILSAHDRFEYARDALRLGVDEYLLKPASALEVLSALGRCLERSEKKARRLEEERTVSARMRGAEGFMMGEIRSQLAECRLEPSSADEFLSFFGLEGSIRAALCFRIFGNERVFPPARSMAGKAAIAAAADAGAALVSADGGRAVYGVGETAGGMLLFPSQKGPDSDAVLDAMRAALRNVSPFVILAGICGPSGASPVALLAIAADACSLAIPGCPTVRLAPSPEYGAYPRGTESAAFGKTGMVDIGEPPPLSLAARAARIIRNRFQEDLSLEKVADEVGSSPSHLSRMIARELGMGFSDFLTRQRIERAKELMLSGASVKQASLLVGFRDQAYFSRVFRKSEGTNPVDFLATTAKKYRE